KMPYLLNLAKLIFLNFRSRD
ncbi:hypothetical protein ACQRIU_003879, partial [Beauveria bassiana]